MAVLNCVAFSRLGGVEARAIGARAELVVIRLFFHWLVNLTGWRWQLGALHPSRSRCRCNHTIPLRFACADRAFFTSSLVALRFVSLHCAHCIIYFCGSQLFATDILLRTIIQYLFGCVMWVYCFLDCCYLCPCNLTIYRRCRFHAFIGYDSYEQKSERSVGTLSR